MTNSVGTVSGTFALPNTDANRFRTGNRVFRLTSSSTNSKIDDDVDTFADSTFTARGLQLTKQETIESTRVPIIRSTTVTEK